MTTEEGNRIIGDFMGTYFKDPLNYMYDLSWDKLMPVVDDIYYCRRFNTGAQSTEISSQPYKLYSNIKVALLNLSIEQTWEAVVEFIQWYNKNQTNK